VRGRLFKLAAASTLALLAWGGVVEPRLIAVTELRLNAPVSKSKTIAVIADLHLNGIGAREQRLLEIIQQRQPDTVILLGDVVDGPDDLPELERFLSALPASQRLAIFGNWEYWGGIDHDALRGVYAKHGVRLLINDCHEGIVGLDDATAGEPDLDVAVGRCRSATAKEAGFLLLQHSPGFFENTKLGTQRFALSLSGHTHGGQIALFGWAPWTPPGSGSFVAGEYKTRLDRLFVTRGIGTSVLPMRIGARPELVFVTIS
jgi:predicted MPP superfamily phosphohydrolase